MHKFRFNENQKKAQMCERTINANSDCRGKMRRRIERCFVGGAMNGLGLGQKKAAPGAAFNIISN